MAHSFPALSEEALEAHLDAATALLGLAVPAGARASVLTHLKATAEAARFVADFPLDDELEPAPVFAPGGAK
ncbi:DUF4089 domain-containing protein [Hansschlegelia sp. KR7-227]|uniref:DUF4089 domain-containing protein n=1 Tax=Hansschlegelia sp. KR7-227 TaxID=3400914 RepID=UPI003C0E3B56